MIYHEKYARLIHGAIMSLLIIDLFIKKTTNVCVGDPYVLGFKMTCNG